MLPSPRPLRPIGVVSALVAVTLLLDTTAAAHRAVGRVLALCDKQPIAGGAPPQLATRREILEEHQGKDGQETGRSPVSMPAPIRPPFQSRAGASEMPSSAARPASRASSRSVANCSTLSVNCIACFRSASSDCTLAD